MIDDADRQARLALGGTSDDRQRNRQLSTGDGLVDLQHTIAIGLVEPVSTDMPRL